MQKEQLLLLERPGRMVHRYLRRLGKLRLAAIVGEYTPSHARPVRRK